MIKAGHFFTVAVHESRPDASRKVMVSPPDAAGACDST